MFPRLLFGLVALSLLVGIFAGFVEEHNNVRGYAGASNMKKLILCPELKKIAQAHADQCNYSKNTNVSSQSVIYQEVGANIHKSAEFKRSDAVVVKSWTRGRFDYKISTNACRDDALCEAYKQVYRAETEYVGCGTAKCDFGFFTVCNYAPRGNPDDKPYKRGKACTACPKGYNCENNLCTITK